MKVYLTGLTPMKWSSNFIGQAELTLLNKISFHEIRFLYEALFNGAA